MNQSRLEALTTKNLVHNNTAKQTYAKEVESLDRKLTVAKMNKFMERQAQAIARAELNAKKRDNPNMTSAEYKKAAGRAIETARTLVKAQKQPVQIVSREHYCQDYHDWSCSSAPILDSRGDLLGILAIARDPIGGRVHHVLVAGNEPAHGALVALPGKQYGLILVHARNVGGTRDTVRRLREGAPVEVACGSRYTGGMAMVRTVCNRAVPTCVV